MDLRKYCGIFGNTVVAEFTEEYSAKNFEDRPEFNKFLTFIKSSKIKIDTLLVSRWDRFSRNVNESYNMIAKLKKLGIEVNAIEQPIDFNIPEQKMMLSFYLTIPEIENDRRALNTTNGMRKNMLEGCWVSTAPFGYKNARDSSNKPILLIITEKAELIKKAYELFASGTYSIDELRKEMIKKGLTLSKMPFWTMLRNPVYCGKIRVKAYAKEMEEIVQGLHEPIISEELFNDVQFVLSGKKKIKAKATKTRVELPLRGYLICSSCGKNLTGSSSKGNGGKFFYYHCQSGCKERHNTELAHKHFEKWLDDISFKPEVAQLYISVMEDIFKTNEGDRDAEIKKLEGEITKINEMLNKATKKLINEEIDRNDFKRVKDIILNSTFLTHFWPFRVYNLIY
ncbi:MAG: recombinase family protein [Bacteroidia bacterium]